MPWSNDSANSNRAVNHSPGDQKIPHMWWNDWTLNFIQLLCKEVTPKHSVICPATGHAISFQIPRLLPLPAALQQIIPWYSPWMFSGHLYKGLCCPMQGSNKSHASHILAYNHKDIGLVKNAKTKGFFCCPAVYKIFQERNLQPWKSLLSHSFLSMRTETQLRGQNVAKKVESGPAVPHSQQAHHIGICKKQAQKCAWEQGHTPTHEYS